MSEPNSEQLLDLILRAFRIFDGFSGPSGDSLFWRTDGKYAPLMLGVNCNDLFHWACSDLEQLTPENIGELERATEDIKAVTNDGDYHDAGILFCCRARKMRPQTPYYKYIDDPKVKALFDACGPPRTKADGDAFAELDGEPDSGMAGSLVSPLIDDHPQ